MIVLYLVRRVLLYCGYSYETIVPRRIFWNRVAFFFVLLSMLGPNIAFLIRNIDNINAVVEILFPFLCEIIINVKLSVFVYHHRIVKCLLTKFQTDYEQMNLLSHSKRFEDAEQEVTRVTILCILGLGLGHITYTAGPILIVLYHYMNGTLTADAWTVPFGGLYPFSLANSPGYEFVYVWHVIYYTFIATAYVGMDMQYMALCRYLVAYWDIFVDTFDDIDKEFLCAVEIKKDVYEANYELSHKLKDHIRFHHKINKMMEEVAYIESPIIFTQFSGVVLILATNLYLVVVHEGGKRIIYAAQTFLSFLQLFVFCYYGHILSAKPKNSVQNIWKHIHWYKYPVPTQKSLVLMILRMQRTLVMAGFGYYECTLDMFVKTIKTIFSVIAVLRSMEE